MFDFRIILVSIIYGGYLVYFGRKAYRNPQDYIDRYRRWSQWMPPQSGWGRLLIRTLGFLSIWIGLVVIFEGLLQSLWLEIPPGNTKSIIATLLLATLLTAVLLPAKYKPLPKLTPTPTPPGTPERAAEALQAFRDASKHRRR